MMISQKTIETLKRKYADISEKYGDRLLSYGEIGWRDDALLFSVTAFVAFFLVWANVAEVDELARGIGRVIPSSEVQVIQNLEGGIIDAFLVKEGDAVEEGQVLLRMSNIELGSEYQANLKRYLSLRATVIRLQAEAGGSDPVFPEDLVQSAPQAVERENALYFSALRQHKDEIAVLLQQLDQQRQEKIGIEERIEGLSRVLELGQEELSLIEPLAKRGTVSKVELLQLESKVTAQEADLDNLHADLAKTAAGIAEIEEKIQRHSSAREAEARRVLSEKTVELDALEEALNAFKDRSDRTEIRAIGKGKVKDIMNKRAGTVVQPGEAIMEVVPADDTLIVEASVNPADVAFLYPGQKAMIKLTAYDYSVYGGLDARVLEISADAIKNEKDESFYRVKLQSDEKSMVYKGETLPIIPGMIANVDILTGKKTIMGYLLSRFKKPFENALHER